MNVRQIDTMKHGSTGATIARTKLEIKDELDAERREMETEENK
jgi:hypothetical protein